MQFFRYFQTTPYVVADDMSAPMFHTMTNITQHARIAERVAQYRSSFYDYIVQDGERPDTVAEKLYGSVDYTWVILLTNNIFSLYDWPLTYAEFTDYMINKYGSVANAQTQIAEYYDVSNTQISQSMYESISPQWRSTLSAYDVELRNNDAKRRIRVVNAQFIAPLAQSLRTLFV